MESKSSTPRMEGLGRRVPPVLCEKCKRRQQFWKGSDPRIKPYEKADNTCEHMSGNGATQNCLKCYTHLRKDAFGDMRCPDPVCVGWETLVKPPYNPILHPLSLIKPVNESTPRKVQRPWILRSHCRSCRLANEVCSGLVLGLRCQRCESLDLECDCRVLRKSCEECMKDRGKIDWKRCAGFRDECDACIEKGIECKEYVREPGKGINCEKMPEDVVGHGKMDVIDGMKAVRAFSACEKCLEEKLECDEKLPGCGGCREKGVDCEYRLLMATISGK